MHSACCLVALVKLTQDVHSPKPAQHGINTLNAVGCCEKKPTRDDKGKLDEAMSIREIKTHWALVAAAQSRQLRRPLKLREDRSFTLVTPLIGTVGAPLGF